MVIQSVDERRCTSCQRWGGARSPGLEPGTVVFDPEQARGPCVEGPWDGAIRTSRTACGRWVQWRVVVASGD